MSAMSVEMNMTLSFVLVGTAAVAAGAVGIRLTAGDRIAAGLPLVIGAGVGVVTAAIGTQISSDTPEGYSTVFLVASVLGFVATSVGLIGLWRRTERERSEAPGSASAREG
jgi:hypothetical protein